MNGNLIGIIAQFGGQTPIKLAKFLHQNKLPILGTQYSSIDLAEAVSYTHLTLPTSDLV